MKTDNYHAIILRCLLALCGLWIGFWIIRVVQNIGQPQMEYSEGFMLLNAHLFASGHWSWQLPSTPPFNVSFYTPIGFYVLGLVTKVFGESLVVGRVLNLSYMLGCMVMVYLIVRFETKDKLVSAIAAFLPMTAVTMTAWSMFIRVDMLAILFELVGMCVALKYLSRGAIFWSIPFFVLAFYTKQSVMAGAVAITLYLLIKNRRRGFLFGGVTGVIIIGIMAVATWLTHGGFFREIILYQRTSPPFQNPLAVVEIVIISLMVYVPVVIMAGTRLRDHPAHLLSIFAIVAFGLNTLTLFHIGGISNYLFETTLTICILAGLWLADADIMQNLTLLIASGVFIIVSLYLAMGGLMGSYLPDNQYAANCQTAESLISDATYPILTENAALVLAAGKQIYYEPFVFNNLAHLGYFNEDILLNDLKSHRIEYVIAQEHLPEKQIQRFDTEVQAAIVNNYHVILDAATGQQYGFVVYQVN